MNAMVKAMIGGVVRIAIPFIAAQNIDMDNKTVEQALEGLVLFVSLCVSVYQKWKVNKKLEKAAATGVM